MKEEELNVIGVFRYCEKTTITKKNAENHLKKIKKFMVKNKMVQIRTSLVPSEIKEVKK